jgi:hypothetical protein
LSILVRFPGPFAPNVQPPFSREVGSRNTWRTSPTASRSSRVELGRQLLDPLGIDAGLEVDPRGYEERARADVHRAQIEHLVHLRVARL